MRLHSVTLHNIRSYEDATVRFPEGSVLLSGDIGSGKTSILLAIEFALFGDLKGEVDGTMLLRHGASKGWVELDFSVDGRRVVIRRSLKRGASVGQEAGTIMVDGVTEKKMPGELKAAVLELLGYPPDLLTKAKSLIFRFTVYTPQEEMKRILVEPEEERLDTLRKIFDLDKYRRVRDNLLHFAKQLNLRAATLEGVLQDLPALEARADEHAARLKALDGEAKAAAEGWKAAAGATAKAQDAATAAEDSLAAVRAAAHERTLKEQQLKQLEQQAARAAHELASLGQEIAALKKALPEKRPPKAELEALARETDTALAALRAELEAIATKAGSAEHKRAEVGKLLREIEALTTCPTCRQPVTDAHKAHIRAQESEKLAKAADVLEKAAMMRAVRTKNVGALEARRQEIVRQLNDASKIEAQALHLQDKEARTIRVTQEHDELAASVAGMKGELAKLPDPGKLLAEKADLLAKARAAMEEARRREEDAKVALARLQQEADTLRRFQARLGEDLAAKRRVQGDLARLKDARHWFHGYLLPCVEVIERRVLLSVHRQFNEYFCEWFSALMDEETIAARLGEDFAPVIEQNGYETYLGNLSGGEKTAVALAYRLALNKVITDFVAGIRTRDLLILDEPTDGFSSEQLDRVKEVLEELACRQLILVSHEPKMEAYVSHILRVAKEGHVSRILQ